MSETGNEWLKDTRICRLARRIRHGHALVYLFGHEQENWYSSYPSISMLMRVPATTLPYWAYKRPNARIHRTRLLCAHS